MLDVTTVSGDVAVDGVNGRLVEDFVEEARAGGLALTGEGGVLQQLTKRLLESALEGETTDHLGYERDDPAGRNGANSRNGHRTKTVLTGVGRSMSRFLGTGSPVSSRGSSRDGSGD